MKASRLLRIPKKRIGWPGRASAAFVFAIVSAVGLQADNRAETYFQRARQLMAQGKLDKAERETRLGIGIAPDSLIAYNNIGAIYLYMGDLAKALASFAEAQRLRPKDPEISFNLGLALYQADRCKAAIPHLTAALSAPAHAMDTRYLLGVCHFELREWPAAISDLEIVRKQFPDRPETLFPLVNAYREAKEAKKFVEAAAELVEKYSESLFAHLLLGEALDTESRPQQAEKDFKRAISLSPGAPQLHFALGYLYWRWKRYGDAIAPLPEELRLQPGCSACFFYLGDIAVRSGRVDEGLNDLKEALRLQPAYGDAYLAMGRAYVKLGKHREAVGFFRRALKLSPTTIEVHYWLGKTLIQIGQTTEGQEELLRFEEAKEKQRQQVAEMLKRAVSGEARRAPYSPHNP